MSAPERIELVGPERLSGRRIPARAVVVVGPGATLANCECDGPADFTVAQGASLIQCIFNGCAVHVARGGRMVSTAMRGGALSWDRGAMLDNNWLANVTRLGPGQRPEAKQAPPVDEGGNLWSPPAEVLARAKKGGGGAATD